MGVLDRLLTGGVSSAYAALASAGAQPGGQSRRAPQALRSLPRVHGSQPSRYADRSSGPKPAYASPGVDVSSSTLAPCFAATSLTG